MRRFQLWLIVTGTVTVLAAIGGALTWREPAQPAPGERKPAASRAVDAPGLGGYAGSAACGRCHPAEHGAWSASHHALAERPIDAARDGPAFHLERRIRHGSLESTVREVDGRLEMVTAGPGGKVEPRAPARIIGVAPLEQLVVPFPGGRYQVASLAYDRKRDEWFDVFGAEDRKPHEWGFWSSRGMTWNSMCAACHMTDLRKGYDAAQDAYETTWLETGVGCEACHGPLGRHVEEAERAGRSGARPPRPAKPSPDAVLDTCGACHARRDELTGRFVPGEPFLDHYRPVLPSETDTYYPDGQVRDEDFEYVSFLLSRMYGEGVRCVSCHEPHSGHLRFEGNALCLSCHKGKIDPGPHSRHDPAGAGGQCAACHMPITTYMQRHPRRDHGFTVPDPLLSREHGVPNACSRCHADRSADWAVEAAERLFGNRLERNTRARARTVAKARRGLAQAVPDLLAMAVRERAAAWRAVAVGLLGPWASHPSVSPALYALLRDPEPLVRAAAARCREHARPDSAAGEDLEAQSWSSEELRPLLEDPVRLVRVEAAWVLRRELRLESLAGRDLARHLAQASDQPHGALQQGMLLLDRGDARGAEEWIRKAVAWDPASAPFHHALALVHDAQGDPKASIRELAEACRLAPGEAEYPFALGLANAAADDLEESVKALSRACEIDPHFARAWYNLGLARTRMRLDIEAIEALRRAQEEDPGEPEYPFARATIHHRRGEAAEAREGALEALRIEPAYGPAMALLETLEGAKD